MKTNYWKNITLIAFAAFFLCSGCSQQENLPIFTCLLKSKRVEAIMPLKDVVVMVEDNPYLKGHYVLTSQLPMLPLSPCNLSIQYQKTGTKLKISGYYAQLSCSVNTSYDLYSYPVEITKVEEIETTEK